MNVIKDPIAALFDAPNNGVLAIITRVEGPSYRPVGAMMAILPNGARIGSLSSGCIEADLVLHANSVLTSNRPVSIIYGQGSPYLDIKLPCGGGLEILLLPNPDRSILEKAGEYQNRRLPCSLLINTLTGAIEFIPDTKTDTAKTANIFAVNLVPNIKFFIFGKGPEASTFAALVQSTGYENLLLSPDEETLLPPRLMSGPTRHLKSSEFPSDIKPDQWSAIVLFFHDHEWEPEILRGALKSDAFYIGAQGSQRARDNRFDQLTKLGVPNSDLERLKGPIGLVPSARDARTLAVSVLAEILFLKS